MNEEEAKTKWCPIANGLAPQGSPVADKPNGSTCQASECMMWRYMGGFVKGKGYCGLANQPNQEG